MFLQSRAALSLLGYCYYHMQDFTNAAECYEQLIQLHPEVEDYKLYHAQSLYGACAFQEAMKATFPLDNATSHNKVPWNIWHTSKPFKNEQIEKIVNLLTVLEFLFLPGV